MHQQLWTVSVLGWLVFGVSVFSAPDKFPGLEWSGDFRYRAIREVARKLDKDGEGDDRFWQRYRLRAGLRARYPEDLQLNLRLVTEPRYYARRHLPEQLIREELLFDRLNLQIDNFQGMPLAVKIGRQNLWFGDGWLIREGTPADGSRTVHFDAIRLTWQAQNLKADLVWIENNANSSAWLKPINDQGVDLSEQDERGGILYLSGELSEATQLDGYCIYKRDHNATAKGVQGEIYTPGVRVVHRFGRRWRGSLELAPQFGHKNGKDLDSFGSFARITWEPGDRLDSVLHFGYEYLSGDSDPDKYFDMGWSREGRYSDLYNGAIDSLDGRDFDSANIHRPNITWEFKPFHSVQIITDYSLLFAATQPRAAGTGGLSSGGRFRGHLIKNQLKHRLNDNVHHRVTTELFFPGNFYAEDRNDVALWLRYGIVFAW